MNQNLLAALISQIGIPELVRWLRDRNSDDPITDAEVSAKLGMDADAGIAIGQAWLAQHPEA